MIKVREYKQLWDYVATQITDIKRVVIVDDESHLASIIKDIEENQMILVAVTPSSDLVAMDEDNLGDVDTCIIYVIMKVDPRNENELDIMNERALTQETMKPSIQHFQCSMI